MITIHKGSQSQALSSHGTVLQTLEKNHVDHVSHCKSGICGACRMKLKSGSVTYVSDPLGFTRDQEILPCVCVADGDIELEC
mgnify:CR=1 FL=1